MQSLPVRSNRNGSSAWTKQAIAPKAMTAAKPMAWPMCSRIEWLEKFARAVSDFPEVVEFYRMSGEIDYLMRVVVPDIPAYDDFYKRLIQQASISDVSSIFAMERIKYTTALPLDYA